MGSATGIQWVEARDATRRPSVIHRAAPTARNDLAPDGTSARMRNPALDYWKFLCPPWTGGWIPRCHSNQKQTRTFLGTSFLRQHPGYFSRQNFHKLIWFVASSRSANNCELEPFHIYVIYHQRNISRISVRWAMREALERNSKVRSYH